MIRSWKPESLIRRKSIQRLLKARLSAWGHPLVRGDAMSLAEAASGRFGSFEWQINRDSDKANEATYSADAA